MTTNNELQTYLNGPALAGSYQNLVNYVRWTESDWWERKSDDTLGSLLDDLTEYVTNAGDALELGEFEEVHYNLNCYWKALH